MFECKGCLALQAENARLWKQNQALLDRFSALTGTLSEVANARELEAGGPGDDASSPEPAQVFSDEAWAEQELAREEAKARRNGTFVPDMPT